jgi:hypothetical protein
MFASRYSVTVLARSSLVMATNHGGLPASLLTSSLDYLWFYFSILLHSLNGWFSCFCRSICSCFVDSFKISSSRHVSAIFRCYISYTEAVSLLCHFSIQVRFSSHVPQDSTATGHKHIATDRNSVHETQPGAAVPIQEI